MGTDFVATSGISIIDIPNGVFKKLLKWMSKIKEFPFVARGEEIVYDSKYKYRTEDVREFVFQIMKFLQEEEYNTEGVFPFVCSWGDYEAGAIYYKSLPATVKMVKISSSGQRKSYSRTQISVEK